MAIVDKCFRQKNRVRQSSGNLNQITELKELFRCITIHSASALEALRHELRRSKGSRF